MNFYQKWLNWFRTQPRWLQSVVIVAVCVLLVVGIWLSSQTYGEKSSSEIVNSSAWMINVLLSFVLVILLIIGSAIVARRWMLGGVQSKERRMQVLETLVLNPKRALHIVKVGDQMLLIGATDQSINLLSELDQADGSAGFAAVLQDTLTEKPGGIS